MMATSVALISQHVSPSMPVALSAIAALLLASAPLKLIASAMGRGSVAFDSQSLSEHAVALLLPVTPATETATAAPRLLSLSPSAASLRASR